MKKIIALLLALSLVCSLLTGCAREEEEAYVPTGNALVMEGEEPNDFLVKEEEDQEFSLAYYPDRSLNPLVGYNQTNRVLFSLMYQGLFSVDINNNPTPILCSEYQVSPSNMTWTFYVEKTACFSDGSPLTAADVVATYAAARESDYYKGRFTYIDSVSLASDGGVTFALTTPYQNLPLILDIPIVKAGTENTEVPIGSGPYVYGDGISGAILHRNTNWWVDEEIHVTADTITLVEVADDSQARDEFQFGDVAVVCANPMSDTYADFRSDFELWDVDSGVFLYLGCNVLYSDFFEDGFLRTVLTYAIDRQTINQKNYRGHGWPATLHASPLSPYYSESLAANYGYDPMKFIDQVASWPIPRDKDGQQKTLRLLVNSDDSARLRTARDIANALTDFGIPTETLEYPSVTYQAVLQASNYDIYLGQTRLSANYDLSEFFRLWGNLSWGGIPNEDILKLCKECLADSGNYYNLHKLLAEDGRVVPILFGSYAMYSTRGMFDGFEPARDNAFFYSLGKTMESTKIDTVYN